MNATLILKAAVAATGVAIAATFAGAGLATADPSPETTLTVQDGGTRVIAAVNGASIDGDGTQGVINGPLEMARPQIKAAPSTAKNGP